MRYVHVIAMVLLFIGAVPAAHAQFFVDIVNHPHEEYIETLTELGITQGYGNKIFRPDVTINRAEFLKILMLAVYGNENTDAYQTRCFSDFVGSPQWYWPYACIAKDRKVIQGYPDGAFKGERTVNLAEALKIAMEAWKIPISDKQYKPEYWYIPYFEIATERKLFTHFPQKAGHQLTRSEMAYLIASMGEDLQKINNSSVPTGESTSILPYECGNNIVEPGEQCDDGNTENDDGCSAVCIVVDQPTHHASLRIDQRPVSAFSVSEGAQGVTLFAFDAIAGRQDAAITKLVFQAGNGNISSANTYQLFIDNTGDGTANILVANGVADLQLGTITFPSLSISVQDGYNTRVELRANIIDASSSGEFSIEFATDNTRFIEAVGLEDGRDITGVELNGAECAETSICWIGVHTIENPTFSILGRGNLYVTQDAVPAPAMQLLAGSSTKDLLRLDFRATGEDITVDTIRIAAEDSVFQQLLLYDEEGSFPIGTAWTTDCTPLDSDMYCASNLGWIVEKNTEKTIVIRGVVSSDVQGVISGKKTTVAIVPDKSVLVVEAIGRSSNEDLVMNNANSTEEGEVFLGIDSPSADKKITSPEHKVVFSKISKIENANSDADQSIVPTGSVAFGMFKFFAADNNNVQDGRNIVALEKISFSVTATNVEFLEDSFALYNPEEGAVSLDCVASGATGNIAVLCSGLEESSVNTKIESGEFIELALRGFVKNSQVNAESTSVLRASLNPLGSRTEAGAIQWNDEHTSLEWVDIGKTIVNSTVYWNK